MQIKWLGHSSFLFTDSKGRRLLTDPFDNSVGYPLFEGTCDVVTVSHQHFDHNYIEKVKDKAEIVTKVGFFNVCDIPITGIHSYHDDVEGAKRGENTIFIIEMDGYRVCHLGDLGHMLTSEDIEKLGRVDVLLIPVGGNFTIDGKQAAELAIKIEPHIIIPMHYKTPHLSFSLDGVETFLKHMKNGEKLSENTLKIEGSLCAKNEVKVLDFKEQGVVSE
jgi:L-ascorbate metabolism protein UlaG (beta-lactamase superfamily)